MKPTINRNKCDGCGRCVNECPKEVLELKALTENEIKELTFLGRFKTKVKGNKKAFVVEDYHCINCEKCVKICHEHAINMVAD